MDSNLVSVGRVVHFEFEIPSIRLPEDLKYLMAILTRPTGRKVSVECAMAPNNTLAISFTPLEYGEQTIEVRKRGRFVESFEIRVV